MSDRKSPRIFVVNSHREHREKLRQTLARLYNVISFDNNQSAIDAMRVKSPDMVIVDDRMLENGRGCLYDKRNDEELNNIPFIVTGTSKTADVLGPDSASENDLYVSRPFSRNLLFTRIAELLSRSVEQTWEQLPTLQKTVLQKTVADFLVLSDAIEAKQPIDITATNKGCETLVRAINDRQVQGVLDGVRGHHNYTYVHSLRVATYLSVFGYGIGMRNDELTTLSTGGLLHDVGKMVTPQDILNKPSKLEGNDWEIMKSHVDHTKDILDRTPNVNAGIRVVALQHHEKLDGSGYPLGLGGDDLSELARMSAIVDIFSALTDERAYKPAFPPEKAFAILADLGDKLDQSLVKVFRATLENSEI